MIMNSYSRSWCLLNKPENCSQTARFNLARDHRRSLQFRQLGNCDFPDRHFVPQTQRPNPFADNRCVMFFHLSRFHFFLSPYKARSSTYVRAHELTCFASRKESFTINKETPTRFRLKVIYRSNYLDDSLGDHRRNHNVADDEGRDDQNHADHWSN